MTLVRFRDFENFQNRLQNYFNDLNSFDVSKENSFSPQIDISEDDEKIIVDAEIPGVKKEDLNITIQDNILTLKGEKKKVDEEKKKNYFRTERSYGSFQRCFTIPQQISSDDVEAKFEDGMLRIEMKKVEPKKPEERTIELK